MGVGDGGAKCFRGVRRQAGLKDALGCKAPWGMAGEMVAEVETVGLRLYLRSLCFIPGVIMR